MPNGESHEGKLFVEEREPATVLWIHAFPLNGGMWRAQVESLRGYRHLVPDLPGFGRTPAGAEPLAMGAAADLLVAELDGRRIERAVVIGCSMGGYVALALARRHATRVRALVLVDTRAEADDAEQRQGREAFAQEVLAKGVAVARDAMLPKLLAQPEGEAASEVARMIEAASSQGIANALRGMALREDMTPHLGGITCPTLVVVGAEDTLIPAAFSERLRDGIPGAALAVIPGAGHLPSVEAPASTTDVVRAFLESLGEKAIT